MPRGGTRPGAGAPKGNLNGLKHGRYSKQFAQVEALIALDPNVRNALLEVGRRAGLKRDRANEVSALIFASVFNRARQVARGERPPGLQELDLRIPADASDAIREGANRALARQARKAAKGARAAAKQISADHLQSNPDTEA